MSLIQKLSTSAIVLKLWDILIAKGEFYPGTRIILFHMQIPQTKNFRLLSLFYCCLYIDTYVLYWQSAAMFFKIRRHFVMPGA